MVIEEKTMNYNYRLGLWAILVLLTGLGLTAQLNSVMILVPFILLSFIVLIPKATLKNMKVLVWLFFLILSVSMLAINLNPTGYTVTSIAGNSTIENIEVGEILFTIDDRQVDPSVLAQMYNGTIKLETNKGVKFARVSGNLGLEAEPVSVTNLKFGLDLKGGVLAVLEPAQADNETISSVISTLQTRINVYGLRESVFRPVYHEGKGFVEISIAGGTTEELKALLENQGQFWATITFDVETNEGSGVITLDRNYDVTATNNSVTVDGKTVMEGETVEVKGVPLRLEKIDEDKFNMTATVFTSDDIVIVFADPQRSRIEILEDSHRWSFGIQLSSDGAQKFAWVTSNLDIIPGRGFLSSPIVLYLDNNLVDSLTISSTLKGKVETEISISGNSDTLEEAVKDRAQLQTILRSGALPTSVEIVQLDSISPTLGVGFLTNAMFAAMAAMIGVLVVIGIRYRKIKIVFPMVFTSLSEVLIILGVAAAISWTIDLPAIAGIIAAVGTGIDSQIMIIDQALRGEDKTLTMRQKVKRAFFVIFGAGGTIIAAMIPLMIIFQMRGFAITTIIGVLVGILITRPAFGVLVQKLIKE